MNNEYVAVTDLMINWNELMVKCDIQTIQKMTDRFVQIVKDGVFGQQYEQMYNLLCNNQQQLEAWGNILDFDSNSEYYKVFAYTVCWTVGRMAEALYQTHQKVLMIEQTDIDIKHLRQSAYIYQVLKLLAQKGEVTQGEIAKHLKISSNALSNFLRRNEKYHLWQHEKYGKFNYYFLTSIGKEYYKTQYSKDLMSNPSSLHTVIISFLDAILQELNEDDPNVTNVFHRINEKTGSSQAIFGNDLEKVMVRKIFRKVESRQKVREIDYPDLLRYEEEQIYDLEKDQYTINDIWEEYAYI